MISYKRRGWSGGRTLVWVVWLVWAAPAGCGPQERALQVADREGVGERVEASSGEVVRSGARERGSEASGSGGEHEGEGGAGHESESGHESGHDHGSGHGSEEASDLDLSVDALFELECEHGLKTHECEECRYEVGVVKAPPELFERGLLSSVVPSKRPVVVPLRVTGEVQFDERRVIHVSTQAEGIVRRVRVTLGDRVEKGQPMVELDSVRVGDAEAAYLEARSMLELARRNLLRVKALREEGIASEKEFLVAEQAEQAARIRVDAALGRLVRLGMPEAEARALTQANATGRLVLRAPMGGTVLRLHAVPGEIAQPNESLATVGNSETVWVWADLYQRDLARVVRAQASAPIEARVMARAYPGEQFRGVVDFISPAMDEASRTARVRVNVPNPDGRLLAGMFVDVDLFVQDDREAIVVPEDAVLQDEGREFVFVHHRGAYYVRRPVTVGAVVGDLVEITRGLDGTERVVANGAFLMKSDVLRSKMGAGCAD